MLCRSTIIAVFLIFWTFPAFGQGSWSPFVTNINGNTPNSAAFLNEQYGFVSTSDGTFRTTDGGNSWIHTNLAGSIGKHQFYFYTPANIFFNGELESIDSGMTWKTLVQPSDGQLYIKNGIFFDASGRISYNHARSWKIIDTNFMYGETIVGNLDSTIAIWGGSAFFTDTALYSTDLGKSWHYGSAGVESDYGYAIPFTNTFFRAGGDGLDAIERSNSGGAVWDTVYGPVAEHYLSDGFSGDGCTVFAQTMDTTFYFLPKGLIRSTDQGATWIAIGGPIGRDDYPLCGAASRGAVCFAMSYRTGEPVWKYIDSSLLRPVLWDTRISTTFPDTLFMNECDPSAAIKLHIDFSSCDYIRFHHLYIDSLPVSTYKITYRQGNIIRAGHPDSAQLSFSSLPAGTYHVQIHLGVSASDWSGSDTVMSFIIMVKGNPAVLRIDKQDTLNFGTSTFCDAGGSQDIHLSNLSCRSLKVTRILLMMDSSAKYDFSTSMYPAQFYLKEGVPAGKITVKFVPQSIGIKTGKLVIFTSIGNDTLAIYANVLPAPKTLEVVSDSFQSPICTTWDGFVHLTNKSCRFMTLDSISLPPQYQILPTRFPVYLFQGDSASLPVRFSPAVRGEISGIAKASLSFFMPEGSETFDTVISLRGFGAHGPSAYSLSANSIQFDTLHLCDNPERQRIILRSYGCDSLPLRSITLTGDSSFSLSESGKRNLAVGDSLNLDVTINPVVKGNKSAVLTIMKNDSSVERIPIEATITRAIRTLTESTPGILDFGEQYTCKTNDTTITLQNQSCDTIQIFGVRWQVSGLSGLGFGVRDTFPISIPPGKTGMIHLQTILDTTGGAASNTAILEILSDADNTVPPFTLSRSYIQPHPVHLWLSAATKAFPEGGVWYLKLKGDPHELSDINAIDFSLNYNTDLLNFLPGPSSVSSTDGKSFQITGSPISIDQDSSIALLAFEVFLTKDTSTTVSIQNVVLNSGDPEFMGCVAYPQSVSSGIDFNYLNNCGDQNIRRSIMGEQLQFSIHPNPVRDQLSLGITSPVDQDAVIEIYDALGVNVRSTEATILSGTNTIPLDLKNLSEGLYLIRLRSANSISAQSFIKLK